MYIIKKGILFLLLLILVTITKKVGIYYEKKGK